MNESTLVRIDVRVKGLPPGVIFQGKGLMARETDKKGRPLPPEEEARLRAHWMKDGKKEIMCIPWVMFYKSICKAGAKFKAANKQTMEGILAPTLSCEDDRISLGTDKFETFEDYCRIPPKTGAMVKIGRALLREWSCTIPVIADCEMWKPELLEQIITFAGKFVGIGGNRPQLKGPYGRWTVETFEML